MFHRPRRTSVTWLGTRESSHALRSLLGYDDEADGATLLLNPLIHNEALWVDWLSFLLCSGLYSCYPRASFDIG